MTAAATAAVCEERAEVRRDRRPCARPGGITLGRLLGQAHEAAQTGAAASCPMCGGGVAAEGLEARCGDCGTRLF